jgi:predicted HicB family RNase H-like nuclease
LTNRAIDVAATRRGQEPLTMTTQERTQTKNMVLRLDPDLADLLATVAEVEGRSVSDVAREAIADLV